MQMPKKGYNVPGLPELNHSQVGREGGEKDRWGGRGGRRTGGEGGEGEGQVGREDMGRGACSIEE